MEFRRRRQVPQQTSRADNDHEYRHPVDSSIVDIVVDLLETSQPLVGFVH